MSQPLKFADLIGKSFPIELGSSHTARTWDEDSLFKQISDVLTHELFDRDFFYNWTGEGQEYYTLFKESVLRLMMSDLDATLERYFVFQKTAYSTLRNVLVFKFENITNWRDEWFKTNQAVSKELKKDYFQYRKKYFGISL
jgi:hypothetical protein